MQIPITCLQYRFNTSMKPNQKDEDLFHLFVQYTDKLPPQAAFFPYFQFMDQSIRKIFNQLKKKSIKKEKDLQVFDEFWHDLTNQDKTKVYCNWVLQLRKALQLQKNSSTKLDHQSTIIQDQIYIKTVNIFNKWQKKLAKLSPTHLHLTTGNKTKDYDLKDYQIRKSRGKDQFAWVLQAINHAGKTLHCKAATESMYNQWIYAITVNITNQRTLYFLNSIKRQRLNPGSIKANNLQLMKKVSEKKQEKIEPQKTLTQLMIDKQMKSIDNDNFTQIDENKSDQFESIGDEEFKDQQEPSPQKNEKNKKKVQQKVQIQESNPNIFRRLAPEYKSLLNFADTPFNSVIIQSDSQYRIYQLPQRGEGDQIILKLFTVFPFPKSLIFQAVSSEIMGWNDEVDVFTVKTKISSENTALIYQKNKSYGLLYRERDFLYLRHCFSVLNLKQKNTFMIDKSIDSIHHPPFMSVVRAEKKIIWGLIEKQNQKQCILVVEGWIRGGGYMNQVQNKQITLKYMKKILSLKGFLKQLSFSHQNSNNVFKEHWGVDFNKQQSVYTHTQGSENAEKQQRMGSDGVKKQSKKINQVIEKQEKIENQMAQFMKRTQEQSQKISGKQEPKSQNLFSEERMQSSEQYVPPPFDGKKFVIIPQKYLKKVHVLTPKQKSSKPNLYPHVRGHHLWKGEWQVLASGQLGYIDEQKMKQQKKVLTYIIKRIGKNIFSGKGILNISLPVDIFCVESNIQRLAMSFGFFPFYLQKAAQIKQAHVQLKHLVGSGIASSLIYMTMQKPFNPILGETYQCWVDGCPIYFEQISHHPPIAAFMMIGRGYRLSGCVQAKMDLSINSGTGNNEGIFTVKFDNGNTFYYTTPAGCLTGLTYGDRKLNMVGKSFYWTETGLFLQLSYNPASKTKGFFGGVKGEGDQKLPDYFEGQIREYPPDVIKQIAFKTSQNGKIIPIIPKTSPTTEPLKSYEKIYGRWNKYVKANEQLLFDIDVNRYYAISDQKYPLPSHSNYREDIVYRRLKNFVTSQEFKEVLEIKQRQDRKLRAKFGKSGH